MASSHRLFRFCITSFIIFFYFVSLSSSQKVTLSLYYETLCPYCAEFIVNQLPKIFKNGLISAIDLQLIPWGNAVIAPDGTIVCQVKHFEFIYCTERLVLENKLEKWADCLEVAGLSRAVIDCYFNGYGNQFEQRYAKETSELYPAHNFVPWVVVNNQPLLEDYQNFELYVCKAYGVNQAPEACRSLIRSVETP